ncbi:MAG TPA: hypothetical protein VD763_02760 [Candidatus Saccharimonadales bacterium]|nr:hypothetical protein [Candidatus Saccharimonadales bacterium]
MYRRLAAIAAAGVLVLLLAAPALAGGWAEIRADAATTTEPPVEGRPSGIGFTVLQHGETPVSWVHPTIHLQNLSTGESMDVAATAEGAEGHFLATVTLPTAGFWSWSVTLAELETDVTPVTMAVHTASGVAPAVDPATLMTSIERARQDAVLTANETTYAEIERLDALLGVQRTQIGGLQSTLASITSERDQLAARLADAQTGESDVPILGVVLIAVLAGAAAGFAMAWLAGRSATPKEIVLSPDPRGSTPA